MSERGNDAKIIQANSPKIAASLLGCFLVGVMCLIPNVSSAESILEKTKIALKNILGISDSALSMSNAEKTEQLWNEFKKSIQLEESLSQYNKEVWPKVATIIKHKKSPKEKNRLISEITQKWMNKYPEADLGNFLKNQFAQTQLMGEILSAKFRLDPSKSSNRFIYGVFDFTISPNASNNIEFENGTLKIHANPNKNYRFKYEGQLSRLGSKLHLIVAKGPNNLPKFEISYQSKTIKKDLTKDIWSSAFLACLLGAPMPEQNLAHANWSPFCLSILNTPDIEFPDLGLIITLAFNFNGKQKI